MRLAPLMLVLGFAGCAAPAAPPATAPPPPETTQAVLPLVALRSDPAIRVALHGPRAGAYRPTILGSRPQPVELEIGNAGRDAVDLAGADLVFDVRRGPAHIPCAARNDLPKRESPFLGPGEKTTLARELCSLPLPGDYAVDVSLARPGAAPEHVGSFPFYVRAHGPNVPRAVAGEPGLFAALGGDPTGVRFTKVEWASGAYHVIARLTNASTVPVDVPRAQVVFRVTLAGHALACTSSHELAPPSRLEPGASWLATVPVTCIIDLKGRYDIHAALATDDQETPLADLSVEVTSDPLLYLPIIPW